MVIKKPPKIDKHAVARFKERVTPWMRCDEYSNSTLKHFIQKVVMMRLCKVESEQGSIYKLRSTYLRFYYDTSDNEITTILPYIEIPKEEFIRLAKYYGIIRSHKPQIKRDRYFHLF